MKNARLLRVRRLAVAALTFCPAGCSSTASVDPAADLVIYNLRVWDGTGAETTAASVLQIVCGRPEVGKRGFRIELVAVGQVLSYVRPLDAALFGCGPVWCS
jgi:hypothetical protein